MSDFDPRPADPCAARDLLDHATPGPEVTARAVVSVMLAPVSAPDLRNGPSSSRRLAPVSQEVVALLMVSAPGGDLETPHGLGHPRPGSVLIGPRTQ